MLSSNQSGFRRFHSTTTSLVNVTDRWLSNIDKRLVTGVLFIDLRKAFDTVNLRILLMKLQHSFGLSGTAIDKTRKPPKIYRKPSFNQLIISALNLFSV